MTPRSRSYALIFRMASNSTDYEQNSKNRKCWRITAYSAYLCCKQHPKNCNCNENQSDSEFVRPPQQSPFRVAIRSARLHAADLILLFNGTRDVSPRHEQRRITTGAFGRFLPRLLFETALPTASHARCSLSHKASIAFDSAFHQQPNRIGKHLPQTCCEPCSVRAVNNPMIVRQAQRQHQARLDFTFSNDRLQR
jgi:hypothetical protein